MIVRRFANAMMLFSALSAAALFSAGPVGAQTQEIQDDVAQRLLFARLIDPADETLGATLQPIGDALRAQLDIPSGQGLLVSSLRADSPSALAGLKQNDILLTLSDKPLAVAEDLGKQLKAAGESPVPLKLLRAGKPMTIQVRPIYRVTLGPVEEKKTEYYIGVSLEAVGDGLRSQLALPADRGVLITDVVAGSPAEKAGIKTHDIVLEIGNQPVDNPENLAKFVQAAQDKPTTLKILHAGKPATIPIAAAVRKVEAVPLQEAVRLQYWLSGAHLELGRKTRLNYNNINELPDPLLQSATRLEADDLRQRLELVEKNLQALRRIESLESELKALREAVDKVNETLKANKSPKRD